MLSLRRYDSDRNTELSVVRPCRLSKQGEKVVIGDNITVGVVQITGHNVVLSFEAPNSTRILRAELGSWQEGLASRY